MREARRAFRRVACAMTRASACGSSWLSVESRRVALATIATPSRADAPRRRPVAAVRHATAAEAPATHWAGRQKARAALASATRLMSESDRASFAAYDVEFVVEISRCRAPLHRSTTEAPRPAADVELYSSTALYISTALQRSTLYILYTLPQGPVGVEEALSGGRSEFMLPRSTLCCVEAPGPSPRAAGCAVASPEYISTRSPSRRASTRPPSRWTELGGRCPP